MSGKQVIARVVERGDCRYYDAGTEFTLTGFTPKGICDSAYAVLSRDAQTMRYGGALPWQRDGRVLTRCPDPAGATWELRMEDQSEERRNAEHSGRETWELSSCRGSEGDCPFALTGLAPLQRGVEAAIEASGWEAHLRAHSSGRILPHRRLRVALAACPNACSQPQIQDVGVSAHAVPGRIDRCTGCGECARACPDDAVEVEDDLARIDRERCIGCGLCVRACPTGAIDSEGVSLRVVAGGKLGRRPALAHEVGRAASTEAAVELVDALLGRIVENINPGERVADVVGRLGVPAAS
jgi:dissimilatory sulfite reductase (desulfoviridin) alpha/beta subunit